MLAIIAAATAGFVVGINAAIPVLALFMAARKGDEIVTKKDFIALANAIRSAPDKFSDDALCVLAQFCREQNPAFDQSRWFEYIKGHCGPNGGKIDADRR